MKRNRPLSIVPISTNILRGHFLETKKIFASRFHEKFNVINQASMNNFLKSMTLFGLFFSVFPLQAQVEKTFFQTFALPDSVNQIKFDLLDDYEVETWNGVQMMVETSIRLENGGLDLLDLLVADGRYRTTLSVSMDTLALKAYQRQPVKNRQAGGTYAENVRLKVYIPNIFYLKPDEEQPLARKN